MRMDATARRHDANVKMRSPIAGVVDPLGNQARESLRQLASTIHQLSQRVDERFGQAVRLLYSIDGHVIVTGLGKSGLVGRKIAATLASTGTPSFFVHSAEALHGDLGMITPDDAVLLISYSGETNEIVSLLPHLKERGVATVALLGNEDSTLARNVDIAIDISVDKEICPNNLAPTSSALATLAMGDAMAVALTRLRGFHEEDFARLHPAGTLGRRFMRAGDVAVSEGICVLAPNTPVRECVIDLARSDLPMALVRDGDRLLGVVGASELRVALGREGSMDVAVAQIMNREPAVVSFDVLVGEAELSMERDDLDALIVIDGAGEVHGVLPRSRKG
jgi:arabinose-5-phosphate isomerase